MSVETPRTHLPVDRGPRPLLRGRLHENAAWYFAGTSTALVATSAVMADPLMTVSTAIYAVLLVGMLSVSALYHRFPWRSHGAVDSWRRADHSMIALFIAGTYAPVVFGAGRGAREIVIVSVCFAAAIAAVVINICWINHPRWLAVGIYLVLGWTAVADWPALSSGLNFAQLSLIVIGGIIYTLGALSYALKKPNFSDRWFGFHEVFHASTIVAAGIHHVAIWLIVLSGR